MIGIYKYTNKINNKVYIGKSINLETRLKKHYQSYNRELDSEYNSLLHQAMRKNGIDNFSCDIICKCSKEELNEKEFYYIKYYNSKAPNGYNVASGGQGGFPALSLFSKQDIELIIQELKNTDKFTTEIAKEWNCSSSLIKKINDGSEYHLENINYPIRTKEHIQRILKRKKIKNNPSQKLSEEDVKNIINDLLNTDLSYQELSKKYDICTDQIERINLGKIFINIIRPIPCRNIKKEQETRALQIADKLLNSKLSMTAIAKEFNTDRHIVSNINYHKTFKNLLVNFPNPIRS